MKGESRTLGPIVSVAHHLLKTFGGVSQLCAPREVVIQQTWRAESDGSYIVLVQSVDHPAVRPEASSSVRAEVSRLVPAKISQLNKSFACACVWRDLSQ